MIANEILDDIIKQLYRHKFVTHDNNLPVLVKSKYGVKIANLLLSNNSSFFKRTKELFRQYNGDRYQTDFAKYVKGDRIYNQTLNKIKKELQNDYTKEYFSD
jgi:hypothetical protein